MADLKFLSLGGLDEHNNKCYVIEIENKIFIFNCGITLPTTSVLGIQKKFPDFNYLLENKEKVSGIFIGEPSYENFGSLKYLHELLPNVEIYTTEVGKLLINNYHEQRGFEIDSYKFKIVKPLIEEKNTNITIIPFQITNFLPFSIGFIFKTKEFSIFYVDNFIVSTLTNKCFLNQLDQLNNYKHETNNILITNVEKINKNPGFTFPNNQILGFFNNIISNISSRVVVGIYEEDFFKIFSLIQVAINTNRPVFFKNESTEVLIKYLSDNKFIDSTKLKIINEEQLANSTNCILIITNPNYELYEDILDLIDSSTNENEKIKLLKSDTFIIACETINGRETVEASLFDSLYKFGFENIYKLDKNIIKTIPSDEDHKFLVNILKPKYIIPVGSLYMDINNYASIVLPYIDKKNILSNLRNGELVSISDNKIETLKKIILYPQTMNEEGVIFDWSTGIVEKREAMNDAGVLVFNLLINDKQKSLQKLKFNYYGISTNELITQKLNDLSAKANEHITSILKNFDTNVIATPEENKKNLSLIRNELRSFASTKYQRIFNSRVTPLISINISFLKI